MKYTFDSDNHVHKLDDKPLMGTTTALDVLGKTLTYWASGLAMTEMGWKNSKLVKQEERLETAKKKLEEVKQMDAETYLALLDKGYKAHSVRLKDSATAGTDLHSACEEWIKGKMTNMGTLLPDPRLKTFIDWCEENVKEFLFSEMHTYSEKLWVGGIVDFMYVSKDDKLVLADIKSAKEVYFNHWLQMGAYDIQLSETGGFTAKGDKVFTLPRKIDAHAVFTFGGKNGFVKPELSYATTMNKQGFEYTLGLYKLKKEWEDSKDAK